MIKDYWKKFIEKQKEKSTKSKIIDALTLILLILLIIPFTRREIKTGVTKVTMSSPKIAIPSDSVTLSINNLAWTFIDEHNRINHFFDHADKLVLVNFWATWCPPCRAEMESFNNLYEEYKDKPVAFLFISTEDLQTIADFKRKNGYQFPVYKNQSSVPKLLQSSSIPATYVIDDAGRIVFSKKGAAKWDSPEFKNFLNDQISKMYK